MNKKLAVLLLMSSLIVVASFAPYISPAYAAPDFTVSGTSPNAVTINTSASSTITVTATGGFAGTVTLNDTSTANPLPLGLSCGPITPSTIVFGPSPQSASLTCSSATAPSTGRYQVTINAASGTLEHSIVVTFSIGGIICIATPIVDTKCPTSTPTFNGPVTSPGLTRIRISVILNDSNPMNGFDITLISSNPAVLKPFDVDKTGTVVPGSVTELSKCIGTKRVLGSGCPSSSTSATLEYALVGGPGSITGSHTTGLLFTAIFEIDASNAASTPVTVGYQTGCVQSSLSATDTTCVSISNGTPTPVPETIKTGSFDNSVPPSNGIASITSTAYSLGSFLPANTYSKVTNITVTDQAGFEIFFPTVTLTTSIVGPLGSTLPAVSLNPSLDDFSTAPTIPAKLNSTMSITIPSASKPGLYNITVVGQYQVQDTTTASTDLLDTPVSLQFNIVDFNLALTSNSASFSAKQSSSTTTTVSIVPLNGFSGTVSLSRKLPVNSKGLNATMSPTTISGTQSSTVTITSNATLAVGTYAITLNGTTIIGLKHRTVLITFTLTVNNPVHSVSISTSSTAPTSNTVGDKITFSVTLKNIGPQQENGTITIYADSIAIATQTFTISANNPGQNFNFTWDTSGYAARTYNVTAIVTLTGVTNTGTDTASFGMVALSAAASQNNASYLEYVGAAIAIVALAAVILLLRRRAQAKSTQAMSQPGGTTPPPKTSKTLAKQLSPLRN